MWAYSLDLRRRVVQAYDERLDTRPEIAERFGVSLSFVIKLLRRRRETGSIAAKRHTGGGPGSLDEQGLAVLRVLVRQQPDASLEELRATLRRQRCGAPSNAALSRYLTRLELPRKKVAPGRRAGYAPGAAAEAGVSAQGPPCTGPEAHLCG